MFPFLSTKTHHKDQVAARSGICLFALLFFLSAALSALPSLGSLTEQLAEKGLAGYAEETTESSDRHEKALKEFTDRPIADKTSNPQSFDADAPAIPSVEAVHSKV